MLSPFDVPGSVRLKDVSRPAPGETPADRIRRLAAKAVIEGCQITRQDGGDDRHTVTSASRSGASYHSGTCTGTCDCAGSAVGRPCKHVALAICTVLAERDRLRALDARGRLKTTRDLHDLQEAERRADRLAAIGREMGLEICRPTDVGATCYGVRDPLRDAVLTVTGFSCTCPRFVVRGECPHHSFLLAEMGWLPA